MAVRKELEAIERPCDPLKWPLRVMGSPPWPHRYVIGEQVQRNSLSMLEPLVRAKPARRKRPALEEPSLQLNPVRYPARLHVAPRWSHRKPHASRFPSLRADAARPAAIAFARAVAQDRG